MTDRELLELVATKVGAMNIVVGTLQADIDNIKTNIDDIKTDIDDIKTNMATRQDIVRLENKMEKNDKALFDGYKQTYEKVTILDNKMDQVNKKLESHDVEIRVIKGGI